MSTIYKQDRNHQNWTGRVPRQSRITGYWAHQKAKQEKIPLMGYVFGLVFLLVLFLFAYV